MKIKFLGTACFLLLLVSMQITCAHSSSDSTNIVSPGFKPSCFFVLGLGIGTPGPISTVQFNSEAKKRSMFSVGITSHTYDVKNIATPYIEFGKLRKSRKSFGRWGLGSSFTKVTIYEAGFWGPTNMIKEEKRGAGIHFTLQKMFAKKFVGIGGTAFVDLNTANSYAGILLTLALGRINKEL